MTDLYFLFGYTYQMKEREIEREREREREKEKKALKGEREKKTLLLYTNLSCSKCAHREDLDLDLMYFRAYKAQPDREAGLH